MGQQSFDKVCYVEI